MSEPKQRLQAPARNALCACGSGKKHKHCCGVAAAASSSAEAAQRRFLEVLPLLKSGQPHAAIATLVAAIEHDPAHFDAHHALGWALLRTGDYLNATSVLSRAVALRPDAAAAHADLATAYDHQNLHEPAIAAYRRAVELAPRLIDAHIRLGQLYAMYSRFGEASDCLERAAAIKPNTTNARLLRADAHLLRRDIPAAERWARKAAALEPLSAAAHGAIGGILYMQGRFSEAETAFQAALRIEPGSAKSWDGLAYCRRYAEADAATIDRAETVSRRDDLTAPDRTLIHFAIGKMQDDRGLYANAMEHFEAGNRLRAQNPAFDRVALAGQVEQTIRHFTPDFIARHAAAGAPDERPLFIVGMYRSGTTLVEQILSSHSQIAGGGELNVWMPNDLELDETTGNFAPDRTRPAIDRYLAALQAIGPSASRITDKLPTNAFRLGAIHAWLPRARIIHCTRDPVDTCLSIYFTHFSTQIPFAAQKSDLVFFYRQYLRVMEHWRRVLPSGAITEICYEDLITNRESETRRLVAATGLEWDESCLHPEHNPRAIATASAWQARQPIYASSVERWRNYEPWLGELRELRAG